jgi:WhiB family redox-sensing transcriptional regulator
MSWDERAACRGADTELFYWPESIRAAETRAKEIEAAKRICRRCPVLSQCREWALDTGERHGVWGGLTAAERQLVMARRKELVAGMR